MKQFYVYFHCKPDGTIFYVGKGQGKRAYDLRKGTRPSNRYHQHIVAKYGKENIRVEVQYCVNEQEALELEIFYIGYLLGEGINLCNRTYGGEGGSPSEATREKMRIAALGRKHTEETKLKIGISVSFVGRDFKISAETSKKISDGNRRRSKEVRDRISEKMKHRKLSKESRIKISKSHLARIPEDVLKSNLKGWETRRKNKLKKMQK